MGVRIKEDQVSGSGKSLKKALADAHERFKNQVMIDLDWNASDVTIALTLQTVETFEDLSRSYGYGGDDGVEYTVRCRAVAERKSTR
jgi:hypothetical protein